jgi:tRNA(Ile)-lysidine synthase
MTSAATPIASDELEALFGPFAADADRPCALAVSGGSDSAALMVLFADWLALRGRREAAAHIVLTVDHGLRAGSAEEARGVGIEVERLGFRHAVLTWAGEKPATGLQEAARRARYALISDAMRERGIASLFTGHTRDDQAETLLMRLARGSGVDGLSAMAPRAPLLVAAVDNSPTREILRPLLDVPKSRLRATLASRGLTWVEDPSNARTEFERVRLRGARAQLDALGLNEEMLARSARRLQRARAVLDGVTDAFCASDAGIVTADALGCITIDRSALRAAGEEIALRVLMRAIRAAGGTDEPVPYGRLEAIVAQCVSGSGASAAQTLARALVTPEHGAVVVEREPGRDPLPVLCLAPGETGTWDGRFRIDVPADLAAGSLHVRPLTEPGLMALRRTGAGVQVGGTRIRAASLVPALWIGETLAAVPALDYWATADRRLSAVFLGLSGAGRGRR